MDTYGAFEAKTHLPKLLNRVEQGESITITRRGRPVARLVPIEEDRRKRGHAAAQRIIERRKRLPGATVEEILEFVREGRK